MTGGSEMKMNMDNHREAFQEEARELLAELECALLELEENPDDQELIGRVFRAMHTIKGSGSMFGFDDLAAFTHEIETVFDQVRNGSVPVTKELIDLTLSARDHIVTMLDSSGDILRDEKTKGAAIIVSFRRYMPSKNICADEDEQSKPSLSKDRFASNEGEQITYRIRFRPPADILERGINPIYLLDDLRQLGDCRVVSHQVSDIPYLEYLDMEICYTYWDIILTTEKESTL